MQRKYVKSLLRQTRCPKCGSQELIKDVDMGEIICSGCGLVVRDLMLDRRPEWRAFTPEEKRSRRRVGPYTSYSRYDMGLSTTFRTSRDAYGRRIPLKTRFQMMRLRRWNVRARMQSSFDRNLSQAMSELQRLSDKLHIPTSVQETAAIIYRRALRAGLVRGRSIKALVTSSLYAACRMTNTPRPLREVAAVSTLDRKEISRCYRLLLRRLRIKMPINNPMEYVSKIASKAGISQRAQGRAIIILRESEGEKLTTGKDPVGLAAAALYIACLLEDEDVTQRSLADAAGVTEVTVRNRYKGLAEGLNLSPKNSSKGRG